MSSPPRTALGPSGLEHEGNGEDRGHVGDRDLGDHNQRLWAVEFLSCSIGSTTAAEPEASRTA